MQMTENKDRLFLILLFALFLSFPGLIAAQEQRYDYNELLNCERNLLYQDVVVNEALEKTKGDGVLIIVVRLGDGENSHELMRRRLYNVRQYFKKRGNRLASEKIIIVEGERAKGYGQVEYYLGGKLYERLLFPKNGYICHSCCGPDEGYYPDKESYERQQKQSLKRQRRG